MTLREYLESLQEFVKENPDSLELEVITSKDDEGNGYNRVFYEPSKGYYDGDDYIPHSQFEDWEKDDNDLNSVCVN